MRTVSPAAAASTADWIVGASCGTRTTPAETDTATARTAASILNLYRKPGAKVPSADAQPVLRAGHVASVRVRAAGELDAPRRDARKAAAGAPAQAVAREAELVPARAIAHG